ncbi:hypothetical protein GDO78_021456 [Eleutherodactylus coqui]|uniref:GB1/RHD3-type G domain-containing protein n=1 Tax=Eleutherodactylus coqui TaxID=57060 RepID=A0A8J6BHM4_ELECQ|nr:hypothetical protein GDO78_021456 [Eleutherodactylus coqui]
MDNPVCLIENHGDGTLQVNKDALDILSRFTQNVVVVAIVGKYQTGKSYLMNILAGRKNGFALGSTVQSKTKGIWMWCVPHPMKHKHTLVLLDTEGLGDVEKGNSQNDSWIFALTVLLSSTLVYNSMGTIDQQAMDQLHYVTELADRINVKSTKQKDDLEDDASEFKRTFPSFVWCVRDFILQLKVDGKDITEDEYLQNALKLKRGRSTAVLNYNQPRECIRDFFHSHKCFVFDRPASTMNLQNLDDMNQSQLEPAFVQQSKKFCNYIYKESPVKTLPGGHQMTGRNLGDIAISYVDSIRSGSIPSIENAVLGLSKAENSRAIQEALSKYDKLMDEIVSKFPTETQEEFFNLEKKCHSEALEVFMKLSFRDENQEYQEKLLEQMDQKKAAYQQQNEEASTRKCRALLQELSAAMEKGIKEGKYAVPGGYKLFTEEKKSLEADYLKANCKGLKSLEVLKDFLKEKESIESTILATDKTLEENEKKLAEQRSQAEAARREKEILEKANMELQKNEEERYKMHAEMLEKKMNEERENMKEENQRLITQILQDQERWLTEGFSRKADMLQEEINQLREENSRPTVVTLGPVLRRRLRRRR